MLYNIGVGNACLFTFKARPHMLEWRGSPDLCFTEAFNACSFVPPDNAKMR